MVSHERAAFNVRQIETFSSVLYITGGIIAGILGLTGLNGLYLFLAVTAILKIVLIVKMGFQLAEYSTLTTLAFVSDGASNHGLSFVLFWTLFYALVHIY